MKKLVLLAIIILIPLVVSMKITEVELNPAGSDSGNEWIEFYSPENIDLSEYNIKNNDGGKIQLTGSFSDYYVYVLEKQWLDNSDEKVFLYKGDDLIDETPILKDSENNDKTWQLCDSWEFIDSTREKSCKDKVKDEEKEDEEDLAQDEISQENKTENKTKEFIINGNIKNNPSIEEKEIKRTTISLVPKDIKTEDDSKELSKQSYAIIGLVVFCIFLAILFGYKKYKEKTKNEFR